jgi:hypothetical protein
LARRRKQIHQADLYRPPAKRALKHRLSVLRGNSRYATPFPAFAFRRVTPSGSATDNSRGGEPDASTVARALHRMLCCGCCSLHVFIESWIGCNVWVGGKPVENAYPDSCPHIASLSAITPQHRLWFGSAFASSCGWADGKKAMVPRGGMHSRDA